MNLIQPPAGFGQGWAYPSTRPLESAWSTDRYMTTVNLGCGGDFDFAKGGVPGTTSCCRRARQPTVRGVRLRSAHEAGDFPDAEPPIQHRAVHRLVLRDLMPGHRQRIAVSPTRFSRGLARLGWAQVSSGSPARP